MNRFHQALDTLTRLLTRLLIRLLYRRHPVKVSGGWVKVRRLALYELDAIPFEDPGPFEYEYVLGNGQRVKRVHDISQWPTPPKPPAVPEELCEAGSLEAGLWHVYRIYEAAYGQHLKRVVAADEYSHKVGVYIVANCLSDKDRAKLREAPDFSAVHQAALNPEITGEEIEAALASSFPGLMGRAAYT